jgi:hypothetical protein
MSRVLGFRFQDVPCADGCGVRVESRKIADAVNEQARALHKKGQPVVIALLRWLDERGLPVLLVRLTCSLCSSRSSRLCCTQRGATHV